MLPALHILCAKLGVAAYDPDYIATGALSLAPFSRTQFGTIWANDPRVGRVRHGFVSFGPEGPMWTFAGTLTPGGSIVEWLDDFQAFLDKDPDSPGKFHRGGLQFFNSLTLQVGGAEQPIRQAIAAYPEALAGATFHGHSLGAPCAAKAAKIAGTALPPVLIACPKFWDEDYADASQQQWPIIPFYVNPDDAVPNVPITINDPLDKFRFKSFPITRSLDPKSVMPPVSASWAEAHSLVNYERLMEAA
jgi:hypothetical protein